MVTSVNGFRPIYVDNRLVLSKTDIEFCKTALELLQMIKEQDWGEIREEVQAKVARLNQGQIQNLLPFITDCDSTAKASLKYLLVSLQQITRDDYDDRTDAVASGDTGVENQPHGTKRKDMAIELLSRLERTLSEIATLADGFNKTRSFTTGINPERTALETALAKPRIATDSTPSESFA